MCGRFTLTVTVEEIMERFHIRSFSDEDLYSPSYNIAPSHSVLAIINDGKINRMGYLQWGLIPPWSEDKRIGYKLINARAETLAEKPSFRNGFKKKRCLIIADSFYEWKKNDDNTKIPMRITLNSKELFAMAGIWEKWKSPEGAETISSCSIITTKSNNFMKSIHDRMPVILKPENEKKWLDPSLSDTRILNQFLEPFDEDQMDAHEVSALVNSPKNNTIDLIREIS